jgi:site-specific DNA-methyltransferase (adenine-specific)
MQQDLFFGDSCEIMKRLISEGKLVDVIITDPPYKVITGGRSDTGGCSGILNANKQLMRKIPEFKDWLPLCYDILKPDTHAYFMVNFFELYNLMTEVKGAGFEIHNLLIWEKNSMTPNRWYMKNCEYIIFARKGKSKSVRNPSSKTVHKFQNPTHKVHPAEKPIDLMKHYISNSTDLGELVLDPFMGTGTTGVAAKQLQRSFIGIEIEEDYFKIAKDRIERELKEGLF